MQRHCFATHYPNHRCTSPGHHVIQSILANSCLLSVPCRIYRYIFADLQVTSVRWARALVSERALFEHVTPPERSEPATSCPLASSSSPLALRPQPPLPPNRSHTTNSQVPLLVAPQNLTADDSRIAYIPSADIKCSKDRRST